MGICQLSGRLLRLLRLLRFAAVPVALACVLAGVAVPPASAAAVCQGWTGAQPPSPSQRVLTGVAVVSACDIWAAGNYRTLLHWTGGASWASFTIPGNVSAVSAVSASDAWAVGETGSGITLILHWNGATWNPVDGADLGTGAVSSLSSVSAVSASDAWAAGEQVSGGVHQPLLEHWDGSTWRRVIPSDLDRSASLSTVSALSAGNAWAVGWFYDSAQGVNRQLIEHWDGSSWKQAMVPDLGAGVFSVLTSVTAASASNAWAAGHSYHFISSGNAQSDQLIEHWDGHTWTPVATPYLGSDGDKDLLSVTATSAGNAWAVGWYLQPANTFHRLVEHWDGSGWTVAPGAAPGVESPLAAGAGPDGTVWVAGKTGTLAAAAAVTGVAQAEFAVNVLGRNLREAGLVSGPSGNLSVANGTSPSVAITRFGDFRTAWTAANNHLWTVDSAGHRLDTMRLVAAGSGPAIAALGAGFEVAYPSAADGTVWLMEPSGYFSQAPGPVTVAAGTSPALVRRPGDGFFTAVHAAGSDHLILIGSGGTVRDLGITLAAGTSPALAALPTGGIVAAVHAAGSDHLVTIDTDTTVQDSGITLAAGTSPAVAVAPAGGFEAAGHAAGSDHLVTVTSDGGVQDTGLMLAAGTSPAIAVRPDGMYQLAYAAAGSGDLSIIAGTGAGIDGGGAQVDTGIPMSVGTSPAVAAVAPPPPATVTVPNVLYLDQDTATHVLVTAGLAVGQVAHDTRCIDVAGTVLSQNPVNPTQVPPGTAVNLTVSTGKDANDNPCIFK